MVRGSFLNQNATKNTSEFWGEMPQITGFRTITSYFLKE